MEILKKIQTEITEYTGGTVTIRDVSFSAYALLKKIERFSNRQFKGGNKDSMGNNTSPNTNNLDSPYISISPELEYELALKGLRPCDCVLKYET
jgi:hypothetical protein